MNQFELDAEQIVVGERARKDMGDINELRNSIARNGLIHPVVVDDKYNLLAGERRLRALKELGWKVPVRLLSDLGPLEKLEVELEENLRRKEFTWPEEVALKARIDAVKRQIHGSKTSGERTDIKGDEGKWGIEDTANELHETAGNTSRDLQLARALTVMPELAVQESKVMAFRMMKRMESLIMRELLARQTMRLPSEELPFKILIGDSKALMQQLEPKSVQCVVTSPPYWNQRDYGMAGQLGLEPTAEEYISKLADVFDDLLQRSLKKDGVLWVNLDDTYADEYKGGAPTGFVYGTAYGNSVKMDPTKLVLSAGLKKKDLVGIPWMFAFEMRKRGWWLRSCVVWYKSSSTPEGTTDRPINVHEYIFMFTKADMYKFNNQDWLNVDPMKRKLRSVWPIDLAPTGDSQHIASYPEELPRAAILASSDPGDLVLDPFVGSGSSGVAALLSDRDFVGFDLNEDYAKAAEQRLRAAYADSLDEEEDSDSEPTAAAL